MLNALRATKSLSMLLLLGAAAPAVSHSPLPAAIRERIAAARDHRDDHPAEAVEFDLKKRLPPGAARMPIERYLTARVAMAGMGQHSLLHGMLPSRRESVARGLTAAHLQDASASYTNVGPGNIGGRTRELLIDPTNPQTFYAAAVDGGVWKSTDGGQTWNPTGDALSNLATGSLVMDPNDPQTLFAGTGEGYFNIDRAVGFGIFTTSDGAATWTQVPGTTTADFSFVNHISISGTSNMLYAATGTGVWRLDRSQGAWTQIYAATQFGGCLDLALNPTAQGDVLFVSCGNFTPTMVLQNTAADTGSTWTAVLAVPDQGRTSLAIAPSNPNVIYAMAARIDNGPRGEYGLGLLGVYRSTQGGAKGTWTLQLSDGSGDRLSTRLLSNAVEANLIGCNFATFDAFLNQGWYDNVIKVDPTNPNRLWAGGIDLFRSDDGGKSFGLASYWWAGGNTPPLLSYAHADHHALTFDPGYNGTTNTTLYDGSDGGVFVTHNATAPVAKGKGAVCDPTRTPIAWTSLNNGYAVTQFYSGSLFPGGTTYFGGSQDNGTSLGTDSGGFNGWNEILGGDGGFTAVNPSKTSILYAENTGLSIAVSPDGGRSFFDATHGIAENQNDFMFINPFIMDPNNPDILWTGGLFAWRTLDGGVNWTRASRLIPGPIGNQASAWAVAPGNSDVVAMGTTVGFIANTRKGTTANGKTFWGSSFPQQGYVSSVTFDPNHISTVYATYSTFGTVHLIVSTDGGGSWKSASGSGSSGLPDVPANAVFIDPENSQSLVLGTDLGLFSSSDGGQTWQVESTPFPNTRVESFSFDAPTRTLLVFTHGRGAWKMMLP